VSVPKKMCNLVVGPIWWSVPWNILVVCWLADAF